MGLPPALCRHPVRIAAVRVTRVTPIPVAVRAEALLIKFEYCLFSKAKSSSVEHRQVQDSCINVVASTVA